MSLTVIRDIISIKSFTTCPTTGFICAKNILTKYNDTCFVKKDKKELRCLNEYIARPEFLISILADFNNVASDNKLDLNYLNTLHDNTETKISNMPDMDDRKFRSSNNGISHICDTYSNDVKFNYMVRKISSGYNKIDNIFVHPLVAIGVAMWMSPTFGSIVKDSYYKFINGDVKHINETIQNLNTNTGLINNFETTTNPLTNEVTMLITTIKKDDIMAEIKDDQLRKRIQSLLDEKNGIIKEKEDNITKLLIKLDEESKKAEDERKRSEERFQDEHKQAEKERKQSEERFNTLMNRTGLIHDTLINTESKLDIANVTLINTESKLDIANVTLVNTESKLDRILPQRVELHKLESFDIPCVIILQDMDAKFDEYNLYVLRIQSGSIKSAIKKFKNKNESINVITVYRSQQPNAVAFWKIVRANEDLIHEINKCPKENWFGLNNMTTDEFINILNEIEETRKQALTLL